MAQQILNVSTPNSGLGDALRDASIKSNENFTELYEGKVDKVTGKDLSDNNFTDAFVTKINDLESNAQVNVQSDWNENDIDADAYIKNKPEQLFSSLGYFDYADLATQTTPISVTANVQTLLTNDTLGTDTNTSQPPYGVSAIWDADSEEFNFSQLSIGDTVDIRVHLKTTTTSANQKYHIDMKFAFDGPGEFENRIFSQYVKTVSEDEQTFVTTFYIGSSDVRDYPAKIFITSDDDATVKVVGWFCRVFRKSVNIVDIVVAEEAPIDGLTYGRKDAEWVEISGGGSVPDATESVKGKAQLATEAETITGTNDTKIVTPLKLKVIRDGLEDQIANKEDNSNKVTTFTGSETSTTKFPVVKAIIDYFTQSRLFTILGIATLSGSNTGDQDLSNLMPYAVARTGAVIAFDTLAVYNSIASPTASNITDDLTGARIGVVQKIYSNKSSEPTFPAGWVKRGSGSYINSALNTIFAEWSGGSTVEYWIVQ